MYLWLGKGTYLSSTRSRSRSSGEISRLGFETQGNEFSYYMMICSSFILNWTQEALEWVIYPWIHSNCNTISDEHQLFGFQIFILEAILSEDKSVDFCVARSEPRRVAIIHAQEYCRTYLIRAHFPTADHELHRLRMCKKHLYDSMKCMKRMKCSYG